MRTSNHIFHPFLLTPLLFGCPGPTKVDTGQDSSACEAVTWYQDADGDGYGDASVSETSCLRPAESVTNATDCDDADPTTYPGAPELCLDGVYNDCEDLDGAAAEAACVEGEPYDLRYADAKLLGFSSEYYSGAIVASFGDANGDGNDDVLVSTGGTVKFGIFLGPIEGKVSLSEPYALISYGLVRAAQDMDGDGHQDAVVGDYNEGTAWVLDGPLVGDVSADAYPSVVSDYKYHGVEDYAGQVVSSPGDVNGDGWGDLVVGAPYFSGDYPNSAEGSCPATTETSSAEGYWLGAAYLVYGPVTGSRSLEEADGLLIGESADDIAGEQLAEVGDVDGDGLDDLFIGASGQCEGGVDAGAAYIVLGPASGERRLDEADMKLVGLAGGTSVAHSLSIAGAGDTNGDGYPDLLVGLASYSGRASLGGYAFLVLGPPSAHQSLSGADAKWAGEKSSYVGLSVAGAGDMNVDGLADIFIGANDLSYDEEESYATRGEGAAALAYGPASGTMAFADLRPSFIGSKPGESAGESVASAGDVDADGLPDLLIGAPYDSEVDTHAGAAYLVLGGGALFSGTFGP